METRIYQSQKIYKNQSLSQKRYRNSGTRMYLNIRGIILNQWGFFHKVWKGKNW